VPPSSYNEIPYETAVRFETHPDRLAAVGRFYGMDPAPVERCRYLEIGCGTGGNVVALAYHLTEGRFLGVDAAEVPIAAGERMRVELDLGNLTLTARDLRGIGAESGEFDYIVAHGVYSWVPAEVRDALLRVCRERLAPNGIAFVSYNTLPGRYARRYLRDLMLFHTRDIRDTDERLRQARWSLQYLANSPRLPDIWRPLVESDTAALLQMGDGWLFHDDFAEFDDPVYFHEFAAHASRHGLQYLGDADPPEMFDPEGLLKPVPGGVIEREQYMDFLKARRFRQTLLCHQGLTLERRPVEDCVDRFLFSSLCHTLEDGKIEGLRHVRITPVHDAARNVAAALGEVYPLPLTFEELIPYAGNEANLRSVLAGMVLGGFADFHVYPFPCQETLSERPCVSRLARLQALDSKLVTSASFRAVELDEVARHLVQLLDGTRSFRQIAEDLARVPGAPPVEQIGECLPASLEWLARATLLEG
jgi:SAM-dependent methyltransferase